MNNTRTVLLWHNNGAERLYLAVNPARITVSRPNNNQVRTLAMGAEVNLWCGRGLREVRLETFLPAEGSPFFTGDAPSAVLAMLRRWQDSGDPVRLIISASDINDPFLIEDCRETLAEGDADVGLCLTLREYKFKSALAALSGGDSPKAGREDERTLPQTYTVKKGDTLWDIACRFYGDGGKWRSIAVKNGVTEPKKLPIGKVLTL